SCFLSRIATRPSSTLFPYTTLFRSVLHDLRLEADNIEPIMAGYDLVLDGTDNLVTRRLVAEAAERLGLPLVSGAVSMFDGQVTRSEEHTSELQSRENLVCRLLLEKK